MFVSWYTHCLDDINPLLTLHDSCRVRPFYTTAVVYFFKTKYCIPSRIVDSVCEQRQLGWWPNKTFSTFIWCRIEIFESIYQFPFRHSCWISNKSRQNRASLQRITYKQNIPVCTGYAVKVASLIFLKKIRFISYKGQA